MAAEPQAHKHPWDVFVDFLVRRKEKRGDWLALPRIGIEIQGMPAEAGALVPNECYVMLSGCKRMVKIITAPGIMDYHQMSVALRIAPDAPAAFMCVMPVGNMSAGHWYPLPEIRSGSGYGVATEYIAFLHGLDCWPRLRAAESAFLLRTLLPGGN